MIYVILAIVLVVVIVSAVAKRRRTDKRGYSYAPDPNIRPGQGRPVGIGPVQGLVPEIQVPTPEYETEIIAHDEFKSDVTDDLLDPRNPGHDEWVKEHPEMESDAEWVAEHPEDNAT